jgi:flavin-dependent dehydrogenase
MSRCDVVIVGARAAGAATAMLLARAGLEVVVVDQSRYGADTLSTHALMRGGVIQLHRWGVLDRVIAAGTPAVRRTVFRFAKDELAIDLKAAHGVDALYAPRRTVLDPILVDAAAEAGAEFRYGLTVTDLRRARDGRVVGIEGRDTSGHPFSIEASMVIGADGLRSTIAKRAKAKAEHVGRGSGAVIYGYWSGLETEGYEWAFQPGLAAGFIPTNDGLTCVFAGSHATRIGRGGRELLETIVGEASTSMSTRLDRATAPNGVRSFGGVPGYMRRAWGPGWALVGDAGYWKDPVSAHGLTDAFRDAELLARAVISSSSGERAEADALAEYQATRDRLSIALFTTTDRIASFQWDEQDIGSLLMGMSTAMADEVELLSSLDAGAGAGVEAVR